MPFSIGEDQVANNFERPYEQARPCMSSCMVKGEEKFGVCCLVAQWCMVGCFFVVYIDFDQQTACGAPVGWSKYTTETK